MTNLLLILILLVPLLLVVWLGYVIYAFIGKGEKPSISRVVPAILLILPLVLFLALFGADITMVFQDNAAKAFDEGGTLDSAIRDSGF